MPTVLVPITSLAVSIVESIRSLEWEVARLPPANYKSKLCVIVEAMPGWVRAKMPSASECIGARRAAKWTSEN